MSDFCLMLVCPPMVEEKLLDTLLADPATAVYTSTPTFSHGTGQAQWSATEQVMGRSRAIQVSVLIDAAEVERVQRRLAEQFAGTGLRWWILALHGQGAFE